MKKHDINENTYFSNTMLIFLALGLDVLVVIGIHKLMPESTWYKKVIANFITIVIWYLAGRIAYNYIRKNKLKNMFTSYLDKSHMVNFMVVFIVLISINFSMKGEHTYQLIIELNSLQNKYGDYGTGVYAVQSIYYLLEAMLICLIIMFGQRWGELKFNTEMIPYGGLILSSTWGMAHLFKSIDTGIFTVIVALIVGVGFVLCKKNLLLTYILAICIFFV